MTNQIKAHILLLIATFLVAGSFIASQKLSGVIDPISLTLCRFVFASIILAPLILVNGKYRNKVLSTLPRGMIIGFFYSLYFIGLFKALESTTALNTGTLFTLVPLLTAVFAIFLLKQKFGLVQFITYFVGILGTCIVVFKGNLQLFLKFELNEGDIIFLFAIISMSLYSISTKFVHKKGDELIVLVFTTLLSGIIWMSIALVLMDIPLQWGKITGNLVYYMLYLIIGATIFTVYLYQQASINLGPKKVMAYVYINPACIALLMFITHGETIGLKVLIGILISSIATIILLSKD
ncbi:DMT family transporter [Arcobacter sp. F2176]|uniref:DMT family transporter n=1 Tax=Arcobacter sp. F2176 TaxID=2044511 RepID=UPI00100B360E|nr:DMT family transporter [Arcobacter sp. F2176]RXJ80555.1 EamA family transporter [Arcobacter sp. F2176]